MIFTSLLLLLPLAIETNCEKIPMNIQDIPTHFDVCDFNNIYNDDYKYSLPENILRNYLSGKAFDHTTLYTDVELNLLCQDIRNIFHNIMSESPMHEKTAIITAGAPGAGKTIKLQQHRAANKTDHRVYAYICPDDVCLKNQKETYLAEIESGDQSPKARKAAYDRWRPGSNAATHLILANLIREGNAFYYGTTSTAPQTGIFFDFLKKQGYQIRLIHVSAPDDVRWESIQERDKTFIQTTEEDVKKKGELLPERINDTFLKYADVIEFYFREGLQQDAVLSAIWERSKNDSKKLGTLQILNSNFYEEIKSIHNKAATRLNRRELYWEEAVEEQSEVIH